MINHDVSVDAITNTLILMAVAMVLTRTIGMAARARAVSGDATQAGRRAAVPLGLLPRR